MRSKVSRVDQWRDPQILDISIRIRNLKRMNPNLSVEE